MEACGKMPANAAVQDTLGFVYLKQRNFTSAIDTLKHAAELDRMASSSLTPKSADRLDLKKTPSLHASQIQPDIYRHLAEAYAGAGLPEEARNTLAMIR
jgi:tetratricopeptide (TPR) repeat protein